MTLSQGLHMDMLKIFEKAEFGEVKVMRDEVGDLLFVGKDIAKALGYPESSLTNIPVFSSLYRTNGRVGNRFRPLAVNRKCSSFPKLASIFSCPFGQTESPTVPEMAGRRCCSFHPQDRQLQYAADGRRDLVSGRHHRRRAARDAQPGRRASGANRP